MTGRKLLKTADIGAIAFPSRAFHSLDDVSKIASIVLATNGPFRLAAYPLMAPEQRKGSRMWQSAAESGTEVGGNPEWVSREDRDLISVMDHALRSLYDEPVGIDQSVEEIFIPLHYLCPWWPGARMLTGLRLKFVTEARIPVLKFGDTHLDPDDVWKNGEPHRPAPVIPLRSGDTPAVLANAYARDLRDLMNRVFPETYSDFGSVRVFPLQFRLEDFIEPRPGRMDLGWANYLSSALVERLGRDVVLKTPAYAVEDLEGGTLLIQLHENLIFKDEPDPPWYEAIGYLEKTTGVKCRVEYAFRPDLF